MLITTLSRLRSASLAAAVVVAATLSPLADAAVIGPDGFGYRADTAAAHVYEDISATGTRTLAGQDDAVSAASIGFEFPFYGLEHTSLFYSSNGLITFDAPVDTPVNLPLNDGNLDPAGIAPLWDDWDLSAGSDAVYVETRGTPGVDLRFIIQWHMVRHFPASDTAGEVDFQAVLFEDGSIEFRYATVDGLSSPTDNNGGSATIGIKASAAVGAPGNGLVLLVAHEMPNAVANGQTIRIIPGEAPTNLSPNCDFARPSRDMVRANLLQTFTPITIENLNDPDGNNAELLVTIDGVFQDEGTRAVGSGLLPTCPDADGVGTNTARIRAERVNSLLSGGNGRIYTIRFTAQDPEGATCSSTVNVCVPAGLFNGQCVQDDQVFDSTACP